MALTLYSFTGDFRALKGLIAAAYNGVEVTKHEFDAAKDGKKPELLAKNPSGKVPFLETPHGVLSESNAIARYLARIRRDTELTGRTFFETAQVDSWVDFASHDVELAASLWVYPILGLAKFDAELHKTAVADMHKALAVVEAHLTSRTFMVGEAVTLADIVLAAVLYNPFRLVFDGAVREAYPCVTRWFYTCVNQAAFAAVLGDVPLCETALGAAGAPAAAGGAGGAAGGKAKGGKGEKAAAAPKAAAPAPAPKEKPAAKAKDEDAPEEDVPKEPKKKDPFAGLAKSTMDLDEWKRTYSNAPKTEDGSARDFFAVMPWFWEHLDKEGYSIWLQKYKYNAENTRDFMTSNLISGFVQRSEEMRRYAFGVMVALGDAGPFEVEGVWMLRGQEIKPLLEANDDAEYHDWIKLDAANPEHRATVAEYWCQQEKIHGKTIMDGKCFK